MPTEYVISEEVKAVVVEVLSNEQLSEFQALRDNEVELGVLLKQKTDANDEIVETGRPVEVKKVPVHCAQFMDASWVIMVDSAVWSQSDANRRRALVHKALMGIEVVAEGRFRARKPDIVEFNATVARFGAYTPILTSLQDAFRNSGRRVAQAVAAAPAAAAPVEEEDAPAPRSRRRRSTNSVPEEEET